MTVTYRGLVDFEQLAQSGDTLGTVIGDVPTNPHRRSEAQPFLDGFSYLLLEAVEMINGTTAPPMRSLSEAILPAETEPVWMGIVRSGRIVISADGKDTVRVFAPGADASGAYETNYSVIRHPLAALMPSDGSPLHVEVYAYQNDYPSCAFRLNLNVGKLTASEFPPPDGKTPVDLAALDDFFRENVELLGGKLGGPEGLTLIGKTNGRPTIAGAPVSIGDLAVAYRAVFHAGDNQAFVSLDPHRDSTRAIVNLGGLLEDTGIGSVVLEADKRFKTLTCGLDPNSHLDDRNSLRQTIGNFATSAERELATLGEQEKGWSSTRLWYYPDSVRVQCDFDYRYARIDQARFTADAERGKSDFHSTEEFERSKKNQLSPSIRESIDHLNRNYESYAEALPPLRELDSVARLMGICSWLRKAPIRNVDLDSLLAVEATVVPTPRDLRRMIVVNRVLLPKDGAPNLKLVGRSTRIYYLSPELDQRLNQCFTSAEDLAAFLARLESENAKPTATHLRRARNMLRASGDAQVSSLLKSRADVKAFASYFADRIESPEEQTATALGRRVDAEKESIQGLRDHLNRIKAIMARSVEDHNAYVEQHNAIVDELGKRVEAYNGLVDDYNKNNVAVHHAFSITEIGGGIALSPEDFHVQQEPQSIKLMELKQAVDQVGLQPQRIDGWVRSVATGRSLTPRKINLGAKGYRQLTEPNGGVAASAQMEFGSRYWLRQTIGSWRDQSKLANGLVRQRFFDNQRRTLQISDHIESLLVRVVEGHFENAGEISFAPSPRQDIAAPTEPPVWWPTEQR